MKLKELFMSIIHKHDEIIESEDIYTFYLIHKPSKNIIHHCSTLYPTRKIAEWSAINYYNWFLQDRYNQSDIVIGISSGIPEIIDNDNDRQPL